MTVKELKSFLASIPEEYDEMEVKYRGMCSYGSYGINGFYTNKEVSEDCEALYLTDANVMPRI